MKEGPRPHEPALIAVPSLAEILADPTVVEQLPRHVAIAYHRALTHLVVDLGARIAASTDHAVPAVGPEETNRAILLDEAAGLLGMKRRTLERKSTWQRLGGYKDVDGHVKFWRADVLRHAERRRRGSDGPR